MLSLDDILAAPRDPKLLQRHLQNLGYLSPPPVPEETPSIAPMTPPNIAPEVKPMTPPTMHDSGHPHLPAMHSEELAEAPTMARPEVPAMSSAAPLVAPMTPPTLSEAEKKALPITSPGAPAGSVPFYEGELERAIANRPDKMSDHPSFGGKVGHVLGRIGNIALDTFAPGVALNIPGTDLFNRAHEHAAEKNLAEAQEQESQGKLRTAQTDEAEATAAERRAQAAKLGGEGNQDLILDPAGNIRGWHDAKGGLHSLQEQDTPQAIKDMAQDWEGKKEAKQQKENVEQGLAGAIQDEIGKGNPNPLNAPTVQAWMQAKKDLADKATKESEEDKAISDYLQGHKLQDTPANRDRVRSILKTRDRPPKDPELAELSKDIKKAQLEKAKEPTPDEQRRADLGENMLENLSELEGIVKRRPDLFGPGAGRLTSARAWLGTGDKDIARLKAIHEYLGMASVGAHAMRNAQHVETAADAVMNAFNNKPEATLAAIGQARKSVGTFLKDATRRRTAIEGAIGGGGEGGGGGETHNFSINGKPYYNVPDDVYQRAKQRPGFKE